MIKSLLFLLAAFVIFGLSLLFFQTLEMYSFTIMLIIVIALLLSRAGKPKFGNKDKIKKPNNCLLYTSPSPRDGLLSRMPSSA